MRASHFVAAALFLSLSAPASAQEWIEYVSKEDRFTVNFPGQPRVTQTTYMSQYGVFCSTHQLTRVSRSRRNAAIESSSGNGRTP